MLTEFLQSWSMFQDSYLAALFCGGLLSVLGVLVVGRDEVFLAAAVAQASVLGVALALTLGWENAAVPAVVFSVVAALATGGRNRRGGTNREEVTAWTFLIASSLAVLLLSHSPIGMKNVQSVLTSTILGASRIEVLVFAGLTAVALGVVWMNSQRLTLLIIDPVMAAAVGLSVSAWSITLSASLGLVTGLAIRSTGLLFTFGCLVLPALVAKNLCRRVQPMFLVAPVVGIVSVMLGLMLAHRFDFPPGQLVVAVLGAALAAAWLFREIRQRMTA
jgi:ABC-type Mn2+/Zn2+ transport system permease subunit